MKKIFLTNFGSLGDLHPFVGAGLALKKAGYEVVVGTHPAHLERVTEAGLPAIAIGPDFRLDDPEILRVIFDTRRGLEILHRKYIFPAADKGIDDALPVARESDLILT